MKNYFVFFEIYGKKMKSLVQANSEKEAIKTVKDKIIIHKVKEVEDNTVIMQSLKDVFGDIFGDFK